MNYLKLNYTLPNDLYDYFYSISKNLNYKQYCNSSYATASTENFLPKTKYTEKFISLFNPKINIAFPLILKVPANVDMQVHTDSHPSRNCVISWALTNNLSMFADTEFYDNDKISIIDSFRYTNTGVLINTQVPHNVKNNSLDRCTLQICIYDSFETVYDIHKTEGIFS